MNQRRRTRLGSSVVSVFAAFTGSGCSDESSESRDAGPRLPAEWDGGSNAGACPDTLPVEGSVCSGTLTCHYNLCDGQWPTRYVLCDRGRWDIFIRTCNPPSSFWDAGGLDAGGTTSDGDGARSSEAGQSDAD
jgi:hypothetical protein